MLSSSSASRCLRHVLIVILGFAMLAAAQAAHAGGGGGNVMPANAKPAGYSLDAMAKAMAYFSTGGNDVSKLPANFPFQIIYYTGANDFTVSPGTRLFVPVLYVDDSPPVLGDYPADPRLLAAYYYSDTEFGLDLAQIEVDGQVTDLTPAYVGGAATPGLLDGGGSHYSQIGAFLTPLNKGKHTITIRAVADGDALAPYFPGGLFMFEITYTVTVR